MLKPAFPPAVTSAQDPRNRIVTDPQLREAARRTEKSWEGESEDVSRNASVQLASVARKSRLPSASPALAQSSRGVPSNFENHFQRPRLRSFGAGRLFPHAEPPVDHGGLESVGIKKRIPKSVLVRHFGVKSFSEIGLANAPGRAFTRP